MHVSATRCFAHTRPSCIPDHHSRIWTRQRLLVDLILLHASLPLALYRCLCDPFTRFLLIATNTLRPLPLHASIHPLQASCSMQVSSTSIISSARFEQLRFCSPPHSELAVRNPSHSFDSHNPQCQRWNPSARNFLRGPSECSTSAGCTLLTSVAFLAGRQSLAEGRVAVTQSSVTSQVLSPSVDGVLLSP